MPMVQNGHRGSEYKTEVALLSRTILLQSTDALSSSKRAGHVFIEGEVRTGKASESLAPVVQLIYLLG